MDLLVLERKEDPFPSREDKRAVVKGGIDCVCMCENSGLIKDQKNDLVGNSLVFIERLIQIKGGSSRGAHLRLFHRLSLR
jgi:hypothetical protein